MGDINLRYKKTHPDAAIPVYAKPGDSGADLFAVDDYLIPPQGTVKVETGIAFEIPQGFEIQIRLRSSVAMHTTLVMLNAPATIDSGYRGPVGIILFNAGTKYAVMVKKGERIAQAVLCPVAHMNLIETGEPSKNIASFHTLLKRAVKERKLNIRLAWDDGFFVQADDGVYVVTDTEQSLLKAGASAIHAVLSMYDDVPAAQNTEHTENGEEL